MIDIRRRAMLALSSCVAAATVVAVGGQAGLVPDASRGPFSVTPVLNAPFSAVATTTITERRKDGTRVQHRTIARYFRDSAGRVRVESDITGAKAGQPDGRFVLLDPDRASRMIYVLDPVAEVVLRAPRDLAVRTLDAGSAISLPVGVNDYRVRWIEELREPQDYEGQQEWLETRSIEGVTAVGRRLAVMLPGFGYGAELVAEQWESPDLKLLLASRISDPRVGIALDHQVSQIRRQEPPSALFEVPPGYTQRNTSDEGFTGRWMKFGP